MHGYKAQPLKRVEIRSMALSLRRTLGFDREPYFPIVEFAEHMLPQTDADYVFAVEEAATLGSSHGLTYREGQSVVIAIRDDVYEGAYQGAGRDRGTVAHEVGHYYLHVRSPVLHRTMGPVRTFEDPEWQAKCWQGELLVPRHLVRGMSEWEVAQRCGVSVDAARIQLRSYGNER